MKEAINAEDIKNEIQSNIDFFEASSISFLILFGSVARGESSWWSDIDFVIHPKNDLTDKYDYLLGIIDIIEKSLKTDRIQLSLWDDLPPHIKFRILKDGIKLIINDEEEFQRIRERTLIEYWDHNIWHSKMLDMSLKNMDGNI